MVVAAQVGTAFEGLGSALDVPPVRIAAVCPSLEANLTALLEARCFTKLYVARTEGALRLSRPAKLSGQQRISALAGVFDRLLVARIMSRRFGREETQALSRPPAPLRLW